MPSLETPTARTSATPGTPTGAVLSLTQAAETCDTSKRTLLRRIDVLAEHGATKTADGAWQIPIAALFAAGFRPGAPRTGEVADPAPRHADPAATTAPGTADVDQLRTEVTELRGTVAVLEAEKRAAESLAVERLHRVEDLKAALRQLEAKPAEPVVYTEPLTPYRMPLWRRILLGV